jgi:protein-disulfide isomerase
MSSAEIVRLKNSVTARDHASGAATARVTLLEYGNFECISCGRAFPVIRQIRKLLGEKLLFVFRHFPIQQTHPHSLRAATAAEAAAAQGKFWEMHDELFTHQQHLEDQDLFRYAKRIGLNAERFTLDMTENTLASKIEADYSRSLFDEHITGTPTFYINGLRWTGAVDVAPLLAAIKAADTEGRLPIPQSRTGIRALFSQIRGRGKG